MPLEDFYQTEDELRRERWRAFRTTLWMTFIWLILSFFALLYQQCAGPTAKTFVPEESLRRVDEVCTNLPKPEQFIFERRDEPKEYNFSTSVSYHYQTKRQFEELMPVFLVWFNENGWQAYPEGSSTFKKDRLSVSISEYKPFDAVEGYVITCAEFK